MKPLFVLAGGFGTRLRSVVSDVPKPLAPAGGKPFLVHLIRNWISQGIEEFIFLLHYEADQIISCLSSLNKQDAFKKVRFSFIKENVPLGTGGAILNAIQSFNLNDGFLVANADTWLGGGIKHLDSINTPALAAVKVKNNIRYGALELKENKVVAFKEKSDSFVSGYINSGLYHLLPRVFDEYEPGSYFSLEDDLFPQLAINEDLNVVKLQENFIDIGIPIDYKKFCKWVEKHNEF